MREIKLWISSANIYNTSFLIAVGKKLNNRLYWIELMFILLKCLPDVCVYWFAFEVFSIIYLTKNKLAKRKKINKAVVHNAELKHWKSQALVFMAHKSLTYFAPSQSLYVLWSFKSNPH